MVQIADDKSYGLKFDGEMASMRLSIQLINFMMKRLTINISKSYQFSDVLLHFISFERRVSLHKFILEVINIPIAANSCLTLRANEIFAMVFRL